MVEMASLTTTSRLPTLCALQKRISWGKRVSPQLFPMARRTGRWQICTLVPFHQTNWSRFSPNQLISTYLCGAGSSKTSIHRHWCQNSLWVRTNCSLLTLYTKIYFWFRILEHLSSSFSTLNFQITPLTVIRYSILERALSIRTTRTVAGSNEVSLKWASLSLQYYFPSTIMTKLIALLMFFNYALQARGRRATLIWSCTNVVDP